MENIPITLCISCWILCLFWGTAFSKVKTGKFGKIKTRLTVTLSFFLLEWKTQDNSSNTKSVPCKERNSLANVRVKKDNESNTKCHKNSWGKCNLSVLYFSGFSRVLKFKEILWESFEVESSFTEVPGLWQRSDLWLRWNWALQRMYSREISEIPDF